MQWRLDLRLFLLLLSRAGRILSRLGGDPGHQILLEHTVSLVEVLCVLGQVEVMGVGSPPVGKSAWYQLIVLRVQLHVDVQLLVGLPLLKNVDGQYITLRKLALPGSTAAPKQTLHTLLDAWSAPLFRRRSS